MLDVKTDTFIAVCEEMNFTRAAEKLHITQPAVSQHIKALEKYYGVTVFEFSGKQMSLTKEGELLHTALLNFRNSEKYLKEQLLFMADRKKNLRLGATLTVGEFMISDMLAGFLHTDSDARISVNVSNTETLLRQLDSGEIEFAILEGDFPKTLYANMLYTMEDFIAVCSAGYDVEDKEYSLEELTGMRLFLREEGSGTRSILEHTLAGCHLSIGDFENIVTIGNMKAIKDLVMADCGITFLYRCAVEDELNDGRIRQINIRDFHIEHEISIVWKKGTFYEESLRKIVMDIIR